MSHSDRLRSELGRGRTRDEAIGELRRTGASPLDCIRAIHEVEHVGLAEAKRLFSECPTSEDFRRFQEALADELEELAGDFETPVTIYVALRDEDVDVWRPVSAAPVGENIYRILDASADHPSETWEFNQGDLVRCVDRTLSGTVAKVAIARVAKSL